MYSLYANKEELKIKDEEKIGGGAKMTSNFNFKGTNIRVLFNREKVVVVQR